MGSKIIIMKLDTLLIISKIIACLCLVPIAYYVCVTLQSIQPVVTHLITVETTLNDTLNKTQEAIVKVDPQLTTTNQSIRHLTNAYAEIPNYYYKNFDIFVNCSKNSNCYQKKVDDLLTNSNQTIQANQLAIKTVDDSLPAIIKNVKLVSDYSVKTSDNIENITHFKFFRWFHKKN